MDESSTQSAATAISPSYVNKKGKVVSLGVTIHAKARFISRWRLLFPGRPFEDGLDSEIARQFSFASRVTNPTSKDKARLRRHGMDTLFFRSGNFAFVVKDAVVVTIEICHGSSRHLNKAGPDDYDDAMLPPGPCPRSSGQ